MWIVLESVLNWDWCCRWKLKSFPFKGEFDGFAFAITYMEYTCVNVTMLIRTRDSEPHRDLVDVCLNSEGTIVWLHSVLHRLIYSIFHICLSIMCRSSYVPGVLSTLFDCKPLGSGRFSQLTHGLQQPLAPVRSLCRSDVCGFVFES